MALTFIAGIFTGALVGVLVVCLVQAAARADRAAAELYRYGGTDGDD